MKEKIRNSELTIFEGRAHTPIYQNVAEFSARILRFLKRVGGNPEPPHRSGLLLFGRLRNRVRTVKQENRDLLVGLFADVNLSMDTRTRLFPIYLSRRNLNAQAPASIAVLNRKKVAFQDDCHPLKWIACHAIASPGARCRRRTIVVPR
ncbi:MAG: hypothetical protein DMG78_21080 [Acidobacteria bacterium]|nr:MAG: hypothetical protein DMG78_21080 [Acidobacteriota bacterium]